MFPRAAQAARDTPLPLTAPANAVQQVMMQWHNIMQTGKQQTLCMPAMIHQSSLWAVKSRLHVCVRVHRSLLAGWLAGTCKLHAPQSFQVALPGRCYKLLAHGRLRGACA